MAIAETVDELAAAILDDPSGGFAVRALTRKPDSPAAKALAARGAEIVVADLDDGESVARAFEGAYGAFCVTNFWEHFSPEKEKQQARAMAEAAKRAGLEHVIHRRSHAHGHGPLQGPALRERLRRVGAVERGADSDREERGVGGRGAHSTVPNLH